MQLSTKDIEVAFGSIKILDHISIDIKQQEFIGIIGPNGSGKSTFLKCLYRVLKPTNGTIFWDNEPLEKLSNKQTAKKAAVVAQHNYYNFEFSVQEVVFMGRSPHKHRMERDNAEDYRIVREALSTVGMSEFSERNFSTLSGGEQQRVILARALAQQTPYLILDEPTNHLDINYQLQLLDIVKSQNITVIAAIHDLNIAAMYCNRLIVLQNGKIVKTGTPKEVLTKEIIKEIYGVNTELFTDSLGQIHIIYLRKPLE